MLDTHCHLDLYPDPSKVTRDADQAGIGVICVTNLPSAYKKAVPHIRRYGRIRLALGLHPLVARSHAEERAMFQELVDETSYIGEVGLDFSPQGYSTKSIQIESFQFVLNALKGKPKVITLHSRRAESKVLEMLKEAGRTPVIFHWYSGSLSVLKSILEDGHYLSVNPSMVRSSNGQKIIAALPPERILTESDGPFIKIGDRLVNPVDVSLVEGYLAQQWDYSTQAASRVIQTNFSRLLKEVKVPSSTTGKNPI